MVQRVVAPALLHGEFDMEPSAELKSVVLRLYEAVSGGDMAAVERLFSRQSGALVIGSDPNEWLVGHDAIAGAFRAQFREMGIRKIQAGDLSAFVEGTVGWAADRRPMRSSNGMDISIRETFVFHKEDEEWKIVQVHASLAVPNAEAFGQEPAKKKD